MKQDNSVLKNKPNNKATPVDKKLRSGHQKKAHLGQAKVHNNQNLNQNFSRDNNFTVKILQADEAQPYLNTNEQHFLHPNSLVFYLQYKNKVEDITTYGFCIVEEKSNSTTEDVSANQIAPSAHTMGTENRVMPSLNVMANAVANYHQDKNFLEVSLLKLTNKSKSPRAKTVLLRAVADYCHKRDINYILGQFSFTGKYPAIYAQELSYLYHYYQMDKAFTPQTDKLTKASMDIMPPEALAATKARHFLPPLLRYYLRLGAKTGGHVVFDQALGDRPQTLNVLLVMPLNASI